MRAQLRPRRTPYGGRSGAQRHRPRRRGPGRNRQLIAPTLIPLATAASRAETLQSFAACIITRCHAQIVRRYAAQISAGLSAAAAVAAWPTVPPPLAAFTDIVMATGVAATGPFIETAWQETPVVV